MVVLLKINRILFSQFCSKNCLGKKLFDSNLREAKITLSPLNLNNEIIFGNKKQRRRSIFKTNYLIF